MMTDYDNFKESMKNKLTEYCRSLDIEHIGIAPAESYRDFEKSGAARSLKAA